MVGRGGFAIWHAQCDKTRRIGPEEETRWAFSTARSRSSRAPAAVSAATRRAKDAQPAWARRDAGERGRLLLECADRFEAIRDELAELLALESGKAIETECRGETGLLVEIFRYFGGLAHELKGHTTRLGPGVLGFTTRQPYGVVAGIVPWNVPLMLMSYKVAAPLLAGNTVVVKLPEQTSYTLIRVLQEMVAVLPDGVVSFLTGSGAVTGNALVTDPLLILADEPTGDLDRDSASAVLELLGRLNEEFDKTIVMVTHDPRAAESARAIVHLDKGRLERIDVLRPLEPSGAGPA